ncbi:hypothetical protein [Halorarius litoreus]|uniref:hypothetical protein n=1 Tax=Halorarius litoreus TaxID=2962676 RepID=UPI0020CD6848|nr:hypothetical protein [Halorarius litoreus]
MSSLAVTLLALLLVSSVAPQSSAQPPRPGTDGNGLNESEAATLWSHDNDSRYISNAAYRKAYGENRTAVHQLANGTDLTFTQPPTTAARWTRADHPEFPAGKANASVYPPHANLTNGTIIRDAHATVFAVTPTTTVHSTPNETVVYAAPHGTVRGVVDYRVAVPAQTTVGNRTTRYSLASHRIEEVRLVRDGEVIARSDGTHHPTLPYELDAGTETLRLEADIRVSLSESVRITNASAATPPNGTTPDRTDSRTQTTRTSETVTVSDTVTIRTYNLRTEVSTARYPNGDRGIAVFRNVPWQGIQLTVNGSHRIRGVWRFYTARDTRWDSLVRSTAANETTIQSPALPVAVHAYPSKLGPRAEPTGNGPELLRVWGVDRATPSTALPPNVTVDVVEQEYTTSYGLAIRTSAGTPQTLRVNGIVRGVNATLERAGPLRPIQESRVEVSVLSQTDEQARLLVRLTAADTGEPIALSPAEDTRYDPIVAGRDGYVELAGERLQTNSSGMATLTVTEPGVYTAQYVPGSWLTHDPAYTTAADTTRWHPLGTVAGWLDLLTTSLTWFLPFALAIYAGRRLGTIFEPRGRYP